jgi:hypothetical protein
MQCCEQLPGMRCLVDEPLGAGRGGNLLLPYCGAHDEHIGGGIMGVNLGQQFVGRQARQITVEEHDIRAKGFQAGQELMAVSGRTDEANVWFLTQQQAESGLHLLSRNSYQNAHPSPLVLLMVVIISTSRKLKGSPKIGVRASLGHFVIY